MRGGVFMYPRDTKDPAKPGRLRLLYEANPISFLIEQAGGRASTGRKRMLDVRARGAAPAHRLHLRLARGSRAHRALPPRGADRTRTTSPLFGSARPVPQRRREPVTRDEAIMSAKHPIIAITGSSGAGTTSVTRTFENIFRREGVNAAIVEGDSFHRYDRKAMKRADGRGRSGRQPHFSHFGPEANLFAELETPVPRLRRDRARQAAASTCTTTRRPRRSSRSRAPSRPGRRCRRDRPAVLRRAARRGGDRRHRRRALSSTC